MKIIDNIKNKFREALVGSDIQELNETISLLQLQLEDSEWKNIKSLANDLDFNSTELREIRERALLYYYKYPLAKQTIRLYTEFAFAGGINKPKSKNPDIQAAINEIWDNKQNQRELFSYQAQVEKSNTLLIDGEIFFVLFADTTTKSLEVASLIPNEVANIITDPDNRKKPMFYLRQYKSMKYNFNTDTYDQNTVEVKKYYKDIYYTDDENKNDIPENKLETKGVVYHVKINTVNNKHGLSELFSILGWVKTHKTMNEDMATWAKAMAKFAWRKKLKGGNKLSVASMKSTYDAKSDLTNPTPATASTIIENDNIDNTPVEYKTGHADWASNIRQTVLMVAAGSGFSEQYFGNPSTANLAIGEKLELPLLKKIEGYQKTWEEIYRTIIIYGLELRNIQNNVKEALIKDKVEAEQISKELRIDIDFPPIIILEIYKYMMSLKEALTNGLIDKKEARFKALTAFGVNNVQEVIENLEKLDEEIAKNPPVLPEQDNNAAQEAKNLKFMMDVERILTEALDGKK